MYRIPSQKTAFKPKPKRPVPSQTKPGGPSLTKAPAPAPPATLRRPPLSTPASPAALASSVPELSPNAEVGPSSSPFAQTSGLPPAISRAAPPSSSAAGRPSDAPPTPPATQVPVSVPCPPSSVTSSQGRRMNGKAALIGAAEARQAAPDGAPLPPSNVSVGTGKHVRSGQRARHSRTADAESREASATPAPETTSAGGPPAVSQDKAHPPKSMPPPLSPSTTPRRPSTALPPVPLPSPSPRIGSTGLPPTVGTSGMPPAIGRGASRPLAVGSSQPSGLPPAIGSSSARVQPTHALPPTVGSSSSLFIALRSPISSMLPPSIGSSSAPAPSPVTQASAAVPPPVSSALIDPSLRDAAVELETSQVETISAALAAASQPKKRGRPRKADGSVGATAKRTRVVPADDETSNDDDDDDENDDEREDAELDGADAPVPTRRRPRKASGRRAAPSMTPGGTRRPPGRLRPRAPPPEKQPELAGLETGDFVGVEVDAAGVTLKDLAKVRWANGKVSERGLRLHTAVRDQTIRRAQDNAERTEADWRRKQIIRRRVRQQKNAERAQRRDRVEEEVSDDEEDSDEEYQVEPDRLTPPGSPLQDNAGLDGEDGERGEGEGEGDEGGGDGDGEGEGGEGESGGGVGETGEGEDITTWDETNAETHDGDDGYDENADEHYDEDGYGYEDGPGAGYFDEDGEWVEPVQTFMSYADRQDENARRVREHAGPVEVEDTSTAFVNSATYGKRATTDRWTRDETEAFFDVLRETGENYTLMKAYFPGRTVKQLKGKGLRENRDNPARMADAIFNRKPIDKAYLARSAGFDIDRPYDRERAFIKEVVEDMERAARGETAQVGAGGDVVELGEANGQQDGDADGAHDEAAGDVDIADAARAGFAGPGYDVGYDPTGYDSDY
ncbi:hypothetical protein Q5752_003597 [Cryptotrichosporon argae]